METNMEDQPFYINMATGAGPPVPKPRRTVGDPTVPEKTSSSTGVHHPYDEVTLNSGRPVVVLKEAGNERASDIFDSITFHSPIRNLPPVPAPRFSKIGDKEDIDDIDAGPLGPALDAQYTDPQDVNPPDHEGIYTEIEEDHILDRLETHGTKPRGESLSKADTIGMGNILTAWYDEATKEMERDLSLNLDHLEVSRTGSRSQNLESQSEETLLRNFDPLVEQENVPDGATALPEDAKEQIVLNENLYVAFPAPKQEANLIEDDELPPPLTAPPPLPDMEPPPVPKRTQSSAYETVWLPPSSPNDLSDTQDQTLVSRDFEYLSVSSGSMKSQEETKKSPWGQLTQELKRKVSGNYNSLHLRRSKETTDDGYLCKGHSGVLYSPGGNGKKKHFNPKWCVLGNGTFTYFDDKYSLAIPKEQIPIGDILSVTKISGGDNGNGWLFDIGFAVGKTQLGLFSRGYYCSNHCVRTFVALQESDRDLWVERIMLNLSRPLGSRSLPPLSSGYARFSWVHMKTGFAGEWAPNWVAVNDDDTGRRRISYPDHLDWVHLDLKKIKTLTLVKDVKNLQAPFQYPVIVIDAIDRSLYLMATKERECLALKETVESWAFDNGTDLSDQQLNQDNVPVVVEECIKFVYGHGCMTEGIYRLAGVNTKIDQLLKSFRRNAWNVKVNREVYSEHDVANCLKRFIRTLNAPLIPIHLKNDFIKASETKDKEKKVAMLKDLLKQLPVIHYNTIKRLIGHLGSISKHSHKNLMTNVNLAALWGPTIMTVDGLVEAAGLAGFIQSNSESDVCLDLLEHYGPLFDVPDEEFERERKISDVLEKIHQADRGRCIMKSSGDVRIWVYMDSKSSGRCKCLMIRPQMTAMEMIREIGQEAEDRILHEVVLQGQLERVIHHKEVILDVTLKWGSWSEMDRRDNYLLLKKMNPFFEEALPLAVPPIGVFGEFKFSDGRNIDRRASFFGNPAAFRKHSLCLSNASVVCRRDNGSGSEVGNWPIEEIWWYFGCEQRRQPPHRLNLTFFQKTRPMERTNSQSLFGNVISFDQRELFIKWIAAMLVAQHDNDICPPKQLLLID